MTWHGLLWRLFGLVSSGAVGAQSMESQGLPISMTVVDSPLPFRQFHKVEITGSAILASQARDILPVQVFTQREIAQSGARDLPSFLQRLPVMQNYIDSGMATGSVLGGPETAAIHGNQSGTLVLLNGRRLPYYGSQTIMGERAVVDLSLLPLAAVERVELLSDGASARYGSDAVAGVVNVITRNQVKGVTVGTEVTWPSMQGGASRSVHVSGGWGSYDQDGQSVRVHASLSHQEAVLAGWRSVSQDGLIPVDVNGRRFWSLSNNWSWSSAPGRNYVAADGSFRNTYFDTYGRCEAGWYALQTGYCVRNTQAVMTLYPEIEKRNVFVQAERALGNGWRLFADALWGQQTQDMVPRGQYYDYAQPGPGGTTYLMDAVPWGLLRQRYTSQMGHAVLGLHGEVAGWDAALNVSHGTHSVEREYTGGLRLAGAAGSVMPEEIGLYPSQYSAATQALFASQSRQQLLLDQGKTTLNSMSMLMSRTLADLNHGPLQLGLGLDVRQEKIAYVPGPDYVVERPAWSGSRSNWAMHGELRWHVTDSLETSTSLRHDHYSDFGGVTTGKLGWKFNVSENAWLRGSLGTGFRAPTLGQMAPVQSVFSMQSGYPLISQGNPALAPEKSHQWTLGAYVAPSRHLALGADLWNLNIRDTFGHLPLAVILASDELKSRYVLAGQPDQVLMPNLNLGRSLSQGIDYYLRWRQPVDSGRWMLAIRGTTVFKSVRDMGQGWVSDLGRYTPDLESLALRHRLTLSPGFEWDNWMVAAAVNYHSGRSEVVQLYGQDGNSLDYTHRVSGFSTLDLTLQGQLQSRWRLNATLFNLFNSLPPITLAQSQPIGGVDTRAADYRGRRLQLGLQYRF